MYNSHEPVSHEDGQVLFESQEAKGVPPKGAYQYKAATSDNEFVEFSAAGPNAHPLAHQNMQNPTMLPHHQ